jgi:FMN reductase (NADPH)
MSCSRRKGTRHLLPGTATYNSRRIIEILQLPEGVVPVAAIVLGFPGEEPALTDRLPLEAVVHYEKYKDYTASDIDRIYSGKEALDQTLELLEINQKETLAQIFTDNRYKKADNLYFSREFLDVIRQQGFMNNE